jgi:ABC-2 type transport system ATP-binding protein
MEHAILARELRRAYGKVQALDGLTLSVERGTIFGLLGPNGAGKTTTVKILTTLSRPDAGEARVAGVDVLEDPRRARRAIGVVGQRPGSAEEATGRENLVLQGELYGVTGRDLKQRVGELLDKFDLADAADRPVRTYSGGMQRRLDVAMGLLHRPQVLFLDEPTTGLDPEVRAALWDEIEGLARDEQMTILLTTHYLEEADRMASDLAIVDRGRVVAQGSPDRLKSELEGDAVHVELVEAESPLRIQGILAHVGELTDVVVDGRAVHTRATRGSTALPAVLGTLESSGVKVASVSMSRPSLDEVYLRHAGRSFEAADEREAA